ncbi:hypothetical protein [Aurantibacillus circumpalustris]|uniref:hypothetical protein n=1 Tax=Aurantibacillus circumpalustris TaxID=3036359 RepID=UPI00295A5D3C|nr:hypothetical protein [Aurantibacillus circumpalustris]
MLQRLAWKLRWIFSERKIEVKPSDFSIIVVGRNDNYGGDFSLRLKTTIDWNLKQLPGAELIYVEWNKIEDKESDCKWIEERYTNAKCYSVSNKVHQTITQNPKMPVMEYFAKNIGMRMATKPWLLMINADCLIGNDTKENLKKLSNKYVYGTHYVSFKWDNKSITENHLNNKETHVVVFPAPDHMGSVVGNFILTHKDNWMQASGYDETLTNVRAGVDSNGLNQLYHKGLKPMVLGTHFHLDHPESIVHGANATHGAHQFNNIPYQNADTWGFSDKTFIQLSKRIWQLEKI